MTLRENPDRVVLIIRFRLPGTGGTDALERHYRAKDALPKWLARGPDNIEWLEPGTAAAHPPATPAAPGIIAGLVKVGHERQARRALGLGRA